MTFLKNKLLTDAIIILVIIIFLQFFSLTFLPENSSFKFPLEFGTGILLILIFFGGVLSQRNTLTHPLDKLVLLFILFMLLSSFMANIYWEQPFLSSLAVYHDFYIYFLYFILVFLDISFERIERIMVILFFMSLVVFSIDFITFPNPLFAWRNEERRNGISIFFYGHGFTFLGAFYFLNKFFQNKRVDYLLWYVLSFVCLFLLTQSRMNLFALIAGFFLLLFYSDLKKKYLTATFVTIAGVIFYSNSNIFNGIKEESKVQAESYKEDVRVQAQKYFLTELQGGVPTMVFGNGIPGKDSKLELNSAKGSLNGFFASDVGLTGIYSYFGLFGAIVWILFFYYVFKIRSASSANYLKAYFLTLLTTAFAGFSIFEPGYMPATILALYLVRCQTSLIQATVYLIPI